MKVISYSLFGDINSFEFKFYARGLYFNARMNKLIYPEWMTVVHVSESVSDKHEKFLDELESQFNLRIFLRSKDTPLCEAMLWRMQPIWYEGTTHVLCRDADAITTYKEAQAVQEWVDSGLGFHSITDNQSHTLPMMGGLIGVKVDHFKQTFPEYNTFEKLVANFDLSKHGSDQDLLMKRIYPKAKDNLMGHYFAGCNEKVKITTRSVQSQIPGVDPKLWESNLCARHIGSPGIVDMETLRFFKRFDKTDYSSFEKQFSDILYWAR